MGIGEIIAIFFGGMVLGFMLCTIMLNALDGKFKKRSKEEKELIAKQEEMKRLQNEIQYKIVTKETEEAIETYKKELESWKD